jgi:hypothetical protein
MKELRNISIVFIILSITNQASFGQFKLTNQGFTGLGTNTPW